MNLSIVKKLNLPASSGCYQFFDKAEKIIYVGKAVNLKSRVFSYWQKSAKHTPARETMLRETESLKWIQTESEIEALLLEANLIKKFQPKFNILLRDDKRFVYIKISTEEEWPRIFMTRKLERSGRYFGPFASAEAVKETLKTIRKIWPFRSCSYLSKKVCLYFRIGKCPGMCEGRIDKKDYKDIIKQMELFLRGEKKTVVKNYELKIRDCESDIKKYDLNDSEYGEIKDKINFLKYQLKNIEHVLAHANILSLGDKYVADVVELAKILSLAKLPERIEGYDISNLFGKEAVGSMVVFIGGEPDKSEYRKFKIKAGQGQVDDVGMLKEILERRLKHTLTPTPTPRPLPRYVPRRRRAKERNDFRIAPLSRAVKSGREAGREGGWPLPDLIVIDGGRAQINAASRVLKQFQLDIPALAISKGDGLRSARALDKIFFANEKDFLKLSLASPALHIIKRVRDEAHRFAISYHRKLRGKSWFSKKNI